MYLLLAVSHWLCGCVSGTGSFKISWRRVNGEISLCCESPVGRSARSLYAFSYSTYNIGWFHSYKSFFNRANTCTSIIKNLVSLLPGLI